MIARWILGFAFAAAIAAGQERLDVRISGPVAAVTAGYGAVIQQSIRETDGIHITVEAPAREVARLDKLHVLWKDLIAAADPDTARRLSNDAAMYPGSPRLYVQTREDGTRGFAVTIEQLKRERRITVPSLGLSFRGSVARLCSQEQRGYRKMTAHGPDQVHIWAHL